jgi:NAD-dependent SIR2 family protein deacetylase
MGLFDIFKKKSREEENEYTEETPPCPECGERMRKKYVFSDMCCENMSCSNFYGNQDDDYDSGETLNIYDAAQIWVSNGKDEDYTFGYSEQELENAL